VVVVAHGCAMEILSKVHLAEHALRLALIKLLPTKCFTFRIAVRWFGGAVVHWYGGAVVQWFRLRLPFEVAQNGARAINEASHHRTHVGG